LGALILFGGSSRYDQLAQLPVRVTAILVIAMATFRTAGAAPQAIRLPALLLGSFIALACVQLIPLPPQLWTALPGRSVLAAAATAAGFEQPWRPITIAPDLTANSLFSLTVPAAVLYGVTVLEPRYREWLLPMILVIVVVSMLFGVVQLVTASDGLGAVYDLPSRGTAPGIFTNRNHQALLLALGLPLLASSGMLRRADSAGMAARWAATAVAGLLVIVLIATGSRTGVLLGGLGLIGGLAVVWSWRSRLGQSRYRVRGIMLAVFAAAVAMLLGAAILFGRAQAIDRLFAIDPFDDKRARALPTVIELVKSYFPAGSGLGTFDPAFRQVEPLTLLDTTYFNQAHNDILQIALEGGAPALVVLMVALAWLATAIVRLWRNNSARGVIVTGRAASIALLLILVASATDYPLRTPIIMAIASALVFQIAAALDEMRRIGEGQPHGSRREEPALPAF
jgi:O-antigen ligase